MQKALRVVAFASLLLAALFLLPCTLGCGGDFSPRVVPTPAPTPRLSADLGAPPDAAHENPPPRLQPVPATEWWWESTGAAWCGLEDYVRDVWCPLASYRSAHPFSLQPMHDAALGGRCLFYRSGADRRWRCLPSLPQIDAPQYTRDGFFAQETASAHACWAFTDWRFVLPAHSLPFLVLFDYETESYRVFRAVEDQKPVLRGQLALPAPFPVCTPARSDVRYFTKGAELSLDLFATLDE